MMMNKATEITMTQTINNHSPQMTIENVHHNKSVKKSTLTRKRQSAYPRHTNKQPPPPSLYRRNPNSKGQEEQEQESHNADKSASKPAWRLKVTASHSLNFTKSKKATKIVMTIKKCK